MITAQAEIHALLQASALASAHLNIGDNVVAHETFSGAERRAVRRAGRTLNEAPRWRPVRTSAGLAPKSIPVVMAVTALLAIVGDFEAHTIGVVKERCPVVRRVLGIELRLRSIDASTAELVGNGNDIGN